MIVPCSLLDYIRGVEGDKKAFAYEALHVWKKGHCAPKISTFRSDLHPKECPLRNLTPQVNIGMCLASHRFVIMVIFAVLRLDRQRNQPALWSPGLPVQAVR
jgi:hypothetical protein